MITRIIICLLLAFLIIFIIIKKQQESDKINIKIGDIPIFEMEQSHSELFNTNITIDPLKDLMLPRPRHIPADSTESGNIVDLNSSSFFLQSIPNIGRKTSTKPDPKKFADYKKRLDDRRKEALALRREINSRKPPAIYPIYAPRIYNPMQDNIIRYPNPPMRPFIFIR